MTPYYNHAGIEIYHGDCREVLTKPGRFDLLLTDPPYGETSLKWDKRVEGWPSVVAGQVKVNGSMWVFGSMRMFLENYQEFKVWDFVQDVIWEKHNGTGLFNDRFRRCHETALHFRTAGSKWRDVYKAPQFTNDATARTVRKKALPAHWIGATGSTIYKSEDGGPRLMRSVIYARSEHGRSFHPTQKPLGVVTPLMEYSCPSDGVVFDPFAGSGSTLVAAKKSGRRAVGIEIEERYCEIAAKRLGQEVLNFGIEEGEETDGLRN